MNCGDWVESCTALVEHEDGRFEIIAWADHEGATRPVPEPGAMPFDDDAEIAA
jgi:hypothetical protein